MGEKNTNNMENGGRDCIAINVEALTYSLDTQMSGNFVMSPECCIFKTPNILSRHNEKAYAPNAFSIGPWHFGKPHLQATQKIKKKYLQGLIDRLNDPGKLRQLEDAIKEDEKKIRDCYDGPVGFTPEVLVKILVLDGCFIIELLRKYFKVVDRDQDDPIFTMSCMRQFLHHDLVMLENQIPWFVLERLFDLTNVNGELLLLAIKYLNGIVTQYSVEELKKLNQHVSSNKPKHILDLLRIFQFLPWGKKEPEEGSNQPSVSGEKESYALPGLHCATSLREAGIKFRELKSKSILDIVFDKSKGVLNIPTFMVQETTETILRNLISLEQCAPNYSSAITSYAKLMDHLIESAKDMEILCKKGIINNGLTMEEASKFFDELYIDTNVKEFYYTQLYKDVDEYCQQWWPRWRAKFIHDYFDNPWAIVGLVVAGLILVLTITGTICSIIRLV